MTQNMSDKEMAVAAEAVLVPSGEMPEGSITICGPKLSREGKQSLGAVLDTYITTGFQATNFGIACEEVNAMLQWCLIDDKPALAQLRTRQEISDEEANITRCRIFLGITSSLLLSGAREALCFVVKHGLLQVMVTPGGGVDADLIRTLAPQCIKVANYGTANQGNISISPGAKEIFVKHVTNVLQGMVEDSPTCTPSELVSKLGHSLASVEGCASSVLYWCAKNNIPVFSPSIVDGWVGDALFDFNKKRKAEGLGPLRVDLVQDVKKMNMQATTAKHTGMIILGGGVVKHHICNANLMRNGADHSVFIGTGQEFDGSDGGARPDEAVSWGKIRIGTKPVKVYTDASYAFPLLVAQTFVPYLKRKQAA